MLDSHDGLKSIFLEKKKKAHEMLKSKEEKQHNTIVDLDVSEKQKGVLPSIMYKKTLTRNNIDTEDQKFIRETSIDKNTEEQKQQYKKQNDEHYFIGNMDYRNKINQTNTSKTNKRIRTSKEHIGMMGHAQLPNGGNLSSSKVDISKNTPMDTIQFMESQVDKDFLDRSLKLLYDDIQEEISESSCIGHQIDNLRHDTTSKLKKMKSAFKGKNLRKTELKECELRNINHYAVNWNTEANKKYVQRLIWKKANNPNDNLRPLASDSVPIGSLKVTDQGCVTYKTED